MSLRQTHILDLLRQQGAVTVDGLAAHFGVTLQTVRRDLTELAEAGRLERVHGGAVPSSGTTNIAYTERRALNADAKHRIAQACAAQIRNGSSVFLNIGTTTEAVAAALSHHRDLVVVTNNMNVAQILSGHQACQTIVTGGALRAADGGLVGPIAEAALHQFRFDTAVIGCSALDDTGEILDFDLQEVGVSRAAIARARRSVLVADHSKFTRSAPIRIASLADVSSMVTDRALALTLAKQAQDWGTQIVVA